MNKKSRIILICFFSVLFVLFIVALSLPSLIKNEGNPYSNMGVDNGWVINKTDISIDVKKDRTANVVEKYEVNFLEPSYSLFRVLPLTKNERYYDIKGKILGKSATTTVETGLISDAGLNLVVVYIDMAFRETGIFNFELSYKIIPPKSSNSARYYMNVVGFGWTTVQSDVSVLLNMPSDINQGESEIFCGDFGSSNQLNASFYTISGKTLSISGVSLAPYQGITVDLIVPKNTFKGYFDFYVLITLLLGLILCLGVYFAKTIFFKNDPVVAVVNFYPPRDETGRELSPLDLGYIIDHNTEPEDVTAMIYHFAAKGYLCIDSADQKNADDTKKVQPNEKNIALRKIRDIEPELFQPYEIEVFNAIFPKNTELATLSSLKKTFPKMVLSVTKKVKDKFDGKLKDKRHSIISGLALILTLAYAIVYPIFANFRVFSGIMISPVILFLPLAFVAGLGTYFCRIYHKISESKRTMYFMAYGLVALLAGVAMTIALGGAAMSYFERAILLASALISTMIVPFLTKRTEYYTAQLSQIIGFKNFLETTEKDRLEKLIESNPSYYYDILPYANVLGVSDVWQEKFASIAVPPPSYYQSNSFVFDFIVFNSLFNSTTSSVSQSVRQINSSKNSSGGFGGGSRGGFGGGGFGGGGGGRR